MQLLMLTSAIMATLALISEVSATRTMYYPSTTYQQTASALEPSASGVQYANTTSVTGFMTIVAASALPYNSNDANVIVNGVVNIEVNKEDTKAHRRAANNDVDLLNDIDTTRTAVYVQTTQTLTAVRLVTDAAGEPAYTQEVYTTTKLVEVEPVSTDLGVPVGAGAHLVPRRLASGGIRDAVPMAAGVGVVVVALVGSLF